MAADRFQQTRDAVEAAGANGWTVIDTHMVRRMTEHTTPQYVIDNGWWPHVTFTRVEFLSFVFRARDRVPAVVYETTRGPWVNRTGHPLSFKRALALLAEPLEDSEFHRD